MLDLRGHRFDNAKFATSAGYVGRFIPDKASSFRHILGANIYYDFRQGSFGAFHRSGLELLGRRWDFRANGYVPLSTTALIKNCVFDDYIGDYVVTKRRIEFISYGYNVEIGYLAVRTDPFLLYGAASLYYLSGRGIERERRGGRFRIRPQYKSYFALEFSVSHDSVYETVYQAEVIISLPLYQISRGRGKSSSTGISDRQIS